MAWFEKAAAMNHPDGALNAGQAYARRAGPADRAKAIYYLQKAADLGRASALLDLGVLYAEGRGVRPDPERARQYYERARGPRGRRRRAQAREHVPGGPRHPQGCLEGAGHSPRRGRARRQGLGFHPGIVCRKKDCTCRPTSSNSATGWSARRASENRALTLRWPGCTSEALAGPKDEARAAELLGRPGAERADAGTAAVLALLFEKGTGVPKDDQQALRYTKLAAEQGNPAAQCALASRFLSGRGVTKDEDQAAELAAKSAAARDPCGQRLLGSLYMEGAGVLPDQKKGIQLIRWAADQGYAAALYDLGRDYGTGDGVTQDFPLSRTYLEAAIAKGYQMAAIRLGEMYATGQGADRNGPKALSLWQAAAQDKDAPDDVVALAAYNLGMAFSRGWMTPVNQSEGGTLDEDRGRPGPSESGCSA